MKEEEGEDGLLKDKEDEGESGMKVRKMRHLRYYTHFARSSRGRYERLRMRIALDSAF